jgi:hypothetical protein
MPKCEQCGTRDVKVHFGSGDETEKLCSSCYNDMIAENLGVELEPMIESFTLKDYEGVSRSFHVDRKVDPLGLFLEAAENIKLGYKFAVHGELSENQGDLLNRLIAKVRSGISVKQVETKTFPNGQIYHSIIQDQASGRFEYDETADGVPLVIMDGRPFTWEEFGEMMRSYEGFQFEIKVSDMTD